MYFFFITNTFDVITLIFKTTKEEAEWFLHVEKTLIKTIVSLILAYRIDEADPFRSVYSNTGMQSQHIFEFDFIFFKKVII